MIIVSSGVLLSLAFLYTKMQLARSYLYMIVAAVSFIGLGFSISGIHVLRQHSIHSDLFQEESMLHLRIKKSLKPNPYTHNYIAEVIPQNPNISSFSILLTEFHGDSLLPHLRVNDKVFLPKKIELVNAPKIPYQFNYREFLKHQHVFGKINFTRNEIVTIPTTTISWTQASVDLKHQIRDNLYQSGFQSKHIAFIESLTLGKKDLLSKDTYQDFSKAGVLHILAVSGLHVGLILLILLFFFQPISKTRAGKIFSSICIIGILWGYAFLVGFTPSIVRAVTMFSFLSFARISKRDGSSLSLLFLSAVVLLVYNPCFVYQIGFQLSYAAVFSIVTLYPILHKKIAFKYYLPKKAWSVFCITLTAQLGVFPLSLYYFHQVPGLFLISNLLLIPFLLLILGTCIVSIIWSSIAIIPAVFKNVFEIIIEVVLKFLHFIASQNKFIIEKVYFSPNMLVLSLIALLLFIFFVYQKKWTYLWLFSGCLFLMEITYVYETDTLRKQKRFYVFHEHQKSVVGFQRDGQLTLITSDSLRIKNYEGLQTQQHLKNLQIKNQKKNYYAVFGGSLFIIDSMGVYNVPEIAPIQYLMLVNSPKVNLEKVINVLQPQQIIADGSNYYTYIKRWRKTALKNKIPFHHTGKKGTFVMDY
ncbi:ComEC/Rec2 family competence protein [Mesonia ostreae]|uniref:ComEC/Rec2 family competence protein n=1 Tax=Mesonia ostreae TaxID=861110 RepID=A0ABU2KHJ5_9FLAO|nr:ComEC/Rec2 family competence protein [Mesonia ostreae]MDT0294164.1 ComEC/Rec2 family competence protein [Mesonia ostreae]